MSQSKEIMKLKIRTIVVPVMREVGFSGSFPHFRRRNNSCIHLLTFQTDKYGGGFVIELAMYKNQTYKTHWGKEIEPSKLTAHDLRKRIRVHPKGILKDSSTEDWFRYDHPQLSIEENTTRAAKEVLEKIGLINSLFERSLDEWERDSN